MYAGLNQESLPKFKENVKTAFFLFFFSIKKRNGLVQSSEIVDQNEIFSQFLHIFIGLPAVAGRILRIRVYPSVIPSFHLSVLPSGSFLGIGSLVFSDFSILLGAHVLMCVTGPDFF